MCHLPRPFPLLRPRPSLLFALSFLPVPSFASPAGGVIDPEATMDREEADQCRKMHELVERHALGPNFRWVGSAGRPGCELSTQAVGTGWSFRVSATHHQGCHPLSRLATCMYQLGLPAQTCLPQTCLCWACLLRRWWLRRTGCATESFTATLLTRGAPLRSPHSTRVGGGAGVGGWARSCLDSSVRRRSLRA